MPDKINNQKGVTLLLAMLIMTTVVGIAISLSVLIISQFEFSANLDHALVSLYTAESGLEEGLNTIKQNRDAKTVDDTLIEIRAEEFTPKSLNSITTASWDTEGSNTDDDYILDSLEPNLESSFDLEGVGSFEMTWYDDCGGDSWIKISYIAWLASGELAPIDPGMFVFGCQGSSFCTTDPLVINLPSNSYNYTFTISPISPIECNISYLKIKAYTLSELGGDQLSIGNKINLKSVGKYSNSQIAVSASIPYRLSPQGIFSFAIFSEGSLEK